MRTTRFLIYFFINYLFASIWIFDENYFETERKSEENGVNSELKTCNQLKRYECDVNTQIILAQKGLQYFLE